MLEKSTEFSRITRRGQTGGAVEERGTEAVMSELGVAGRSVACLMKGRRKAMRSNHVLFCDW